MIIIEAKQFFSSISVVFKVKLRKLHVHACYRDPYFTANFKIRKNINNNKNYFRICYNLATFFYIIVIAEFPGTSMFDNFFTIYSTRIFEKRIFKLNFSFFIFQLKLRHLNLFTRKLLKLYLNYNQMFFFKLMHYLNCFEKLYEFLCL